MESSAENTGMELVFSEHGGGSMSTARTDRGCRVSLRHSEVIRVNTICYIEGLVAMSLPGSANLGQGRGLFIDQRRVH